MRKTHRNIVLALDMSDGMKKPDFSDGMSFARFEALKKAAMQFIRSQLRFKNTLKFKPIYTCNFIQMI